MAELSSSVLRCSCLNVWCLNIWPFSELSCVHDVRCQHQHWYEYARDEDTQQKEITEGEEYIVICRQVVISFCRFDPSEKHSTVAGVIDPSLNPTTWWSTRDATLLMFIFAISVENVSEARRKWNVTSKYQSKHTLKWRLKLFHLRLMHLPPAPPKEIAGKITECAVH